MRWKTVDQILRVIGVAAQRFSQGYGIDSSYQDGVRLVSREDGVAYQTIGDACRRRLDLDNVGEFKRMLRTALEGNPNDLRDLILGKVPFYEQRINEFFQKLKNGVGITNPKTSEPFVSYTIHLQKGDSDILRALAQLLGTMPEEILAEIAIEVIKDRMKKTVSKL